MQKHPCATQQCPIAIPTLAYKIPKHFLNNTTPSSKKFYFAANLFMHQNNCTNCNQIYYGNFCNNCGQKHAHRYTVKHVLHELVHLFTHADKSIFSFVQHILIRPGTVALDLVEGKRKRYFNLFQYLLIIVGITTFLITKTHFVEITMQNINSFARNDNTKISAQLANLQKQSAVVLQKYNNILQMILIPVFALFSWLFLGKRKYNYAENIVLHTAGSAQTNTVAIVTTLCFFISSNKSFFLIMTIISLLIMLFSFALCYRQFYKISWGKALLFALLVYICSYIVQMVLITILMIAYLIINLL